VVLAVSDPAGAFERTELDLAGIGFALLGAAMWAAYILLSAQTGRRWDGVEGLALASVVATVLLAPFAVPAGGEDLLDPTILLLGVVVGLLSSAIPYAVERSRTPSIWWRCAGSGPTCSAS